MSVREYQENGQTLFKVSGSVRSAKILGVRKQYERKGISSKKEAEQLDKFLYRDAVSYIQSKEAKGFSWGEVIDAFFQNEIDLRRRGLPCLGIDTRDDYESMLYSWTKNYLSKSAADLTQADVYDVLQAMREEDISNSHQVKVLQVVRKIYSFGLQRRLILGTDRNPCDAIKLRRDHKHRVEGLNASQVRFLLEKAKELMPEWYPIWVTALNTGMRNGELYALRWKNVNLDDKQIKICESYNSRRKAFKTPKNGETRIVPINSFLEKVLRELKAKDPTAEFVLPRNWKWDQGRQAEVLRQFLAGIGLPTMRAHDTRSVWATELIRAKVAPITVMQMGGWKDIKTMGIYIRRAGIEVNGATDVLSFEAPQQVAAKVVDLFGTR